MTIRKFRFTESNNLQGDEAPDEIWGPEHGYDVDTETGKVLMVFPGEASQDVSWIVKPEFIFELAKIPHDDLNEVFN